MTFPQLLVQMEAKLLGICVRRGCASCVLGQIWNSHHFVALSPPWYQYAIGYLTTWLPAVCKMMSPMYHGKCPIKEVPHTSAMDVEK